MIKINQIYNENNIKTLEKMPNDYIDLTITSPPYDNLRDYIGYSVDYDKLIKLLYKKTKKGGVVVWVVGDQTLNGSETGTSFKQALLFQKHGFKIHDTMIYAKNGSPFPAGIKSNRYTQIFEFMFVFSKGVPKTFNLIKDKKNKYFGEVKRHHNSRKKDGKMDLKDKTYSIKKNGIRYNIWQYNTGKNNSTKDKIAFKHPAIFPEQLALDHITTWSQPNEIIYDCFGGSGTTAKAALKLKRKFIISEISKTYCEIIKQRLKTI